MHELGIVFHIADTVTNIAKENNVSSIRKVVLELGEVSTVVPDYLLDCWNWNSKRTEMLKNCELEIETIQAITHCEDCGKDYPTIPQGKICPHCGSEHTYLIRGSETNIKEIVVNDE